MNVTLTLAKPEDLDRLERLVAAFHDHKGLETSEAHRRDALAPLLAGSPHGAVYLIGPPKSPVGYIAVAFGWAIEFGGLDGFVDELFIRPGVRGRGMGSGALAQLSAVLGRHGVKALHLEVGPENAAAQEIYRREGFRLRQDYHLMTKRL